MAKRNTIKKAHELSKKLEKSTIGYTNQEIDMALHTLKQIQMICFVRSVIEDNKS